MIELYLGPPGGGKSYHAIRSGLRHLGNGGYVVANFPLLPSKDPKRRGFDAKHWHYVAEVPDPEYLIAKSADWGLIGKEGRILLILDEAQVIFNSRDWMIGGEKRKRWIRFFSQSRKLGYDIILICPDERMLDRQIRSCAEFRTKHYTLNQYWLLSWLPIKLFVAVRFWAGGAFRGKAEVFPLLKRVGNRYDSMRMFGGEETAGGKRGSAQPGFPSSAAAVSSFEA